MTWTRFDPINHGLDTMPVPAAEQVDLIRGNGDHLMRQSPADQGFWFVNTLPSSNQTAFNDASTVWRPGPTIVHAGRDRPIRSVRVVVQAYMTVGGSATLRITASRAWRIVADPPDNNDTKAESVTGAVTSLVATAPDEISLTIPITFENATLWYYGTGGNEVDSGYFVTYLTLQARVNNAANTCWIKGITRGEVDP